MGVIHDSGVYRYEGQNQPVEFAQPDRGRDGAGAGAERDAGHRRSRNSPSPTSTTCCGPTCRSCWPRRVWYSPANKKVKLDAKYDAKLLTTPEKVATLIQPDWKWYNARKDDIDARVTKILKG